MEAESDHRDKQREMEEIDEILRKRLADPSTEKENEVSACSDFYVLSFIISFP